MTRDFPKPLLPVADKPVIDYLMDQLVDLPELRVVHIVGNARFFNHFEDWRRNYIKKIQRKNLSIEIYNDGATANENRRGASVDLQLVLKSVSETSRTLVSAGDNIYRFSIRPLWQKFLGSRHHYIVALPERDADNLKKTGVLELDANGRVMRQHEKPEQPQSTWSCPPLYFLQASAWSKLDEFIESSDNIDAPGYFIDYLCQKEDVYAFKLNASRLDIGSVESYQDADRLMRAELRRTK